MKLKQIIGFKTKYKGRLFLQRFKGAEHFKQNQQNATEKQAYFFLAADYGNLGDVAITYAQTRFIQEHSDYNVVEIPISRTLEGYWFVKRNIKSGDIITLVGGGNMGNQYEQIEVIRQIIVSGFRKNKIISFPQTFDFSADKQGLSALNKAANIYNNHKNCTLIAREKVSYNLIKQHFPKCNALLSPDIVMSLDENEKVGVRNGAVFCMRNDAEKKISDADSQKLREIVSGYFNTVLDYDTHIGKNKLNQEERNAELKKIWNAFRDANLVITDRLHGMIFCYITSTPCIVINNNNHKITGCYKWISDKSNIVLFENYDGTEIKKIIQSKFYERQVFSALNYEFKGIGDLLNND